MADRRLLERMRRELLRVAFDEHLSVSESAVVRLAEVAAAVAATIPAPSARRPLGMPTFRPPDVPPSSSP